MYGTNGALPTQDSILRDALDSSAGRKYADQLRDAHPNDLTELAGTMWAAGDPRDWWRKLHGSRERRPGSGRDSARS